MPDVQDVGCSSAQPGHKLQCRKQQSLVQVVPRLLPPQGSWAGNGCEQLPTSFQLCSGVACPLLISCEWWKSTAHAVQWKKQN